MGIIIKEDNDDIWGCIGCLMFIGAGLVGAVIVFLLFA